MMGMVRITFVQISQRPFAKLAPEAGTGATAHKPDSDCNYEDDNDD